MVQEITFNEYQELCGKNTGHGMRFRLNPEQVEEWKKNNKFKHLKNELINIPNIKFICTVESDGRCCYVFFTHSEALTSRITNIVASLMHNDEYIHITDAKNTSCYSQVYDNARGTPKLCKLF